MLQCFHTLEAPGVPIGFTYQSKAGTLSLSASSYALDLRHGVFFLRKIQLRDPKGEIVAQLESLTASGLKPLLGGDQIIRVEGNRLSGKLTREKGGHFAIQDFLPEQKGSPSTIPFDIQLNDCHVLFVDRTAPTEWTHMIDANRVRVSGIGRNWVANSTVSIPGTGSLGVNLSNLSGDSLRVSGTTTELQVTPILKHFLQTPDANILGDFTRLSFDSATVQGPFSLTIPLGKTPNLELHVQSRMRNIRFQQYSASEAKFDGVVNTHGISGFLSAKTGAISATFSGSAVWTGHKQLAGNVSIDGADSDTLPDWLARLVRKDLTFHGGHFGGWISGKSLDDYRISGHVEARAASYAKETITAPAIDLDATPQRIALKLTRGDYNNHPVEGSFRFAPKTMTIIGTASTRSLNIGAVAVRFGYRQLSGTANLDASITGRISDPTISFVVNGEGALSLAKDRTLSLGKFEGLGKYEKESLQLDRAYFDTPEGLVSAHGSLGRSGSLGLSVVARGLQINSYGPDLSGTANLVATIRGTLQNPTSIGRLEGFDLGYKNQVVPAVVANFKADRSHVELDSIEAARGTTSLTGSADYRFKSGKIDGSLVAHDIQVADLIGNEFVGAIDVPTIQLGGTLKHPLIEASFQGSSLVARGVKLDTLNGHVETDGKTVSLQELNVSGADGQVTANGTYDIETNIARLTVSATALSLDKLAPELSDSIAVAGSVSGQASLVVDSGKLSHVNVSGELNKISVNGSPVGSGPIQLQSDGQKYTGSAEIGDLQRFVTLDNVSFNADSKKASGDLTLFNIRAENVIAATLRYFPNLDFDTRDRLQALKAELNLSSHFDGSLEAPAVAVQSFQASDITYRSQPVGELNSVFSLKDHKWDIKAFGLTKGPIIFNASGTVDEHGDAHIDGNTDNQVNLSKLGLFEPRLGALTGNAHLWFSLDGPIKTPTLVASLKVNDLLAPPVSNPTPADEDKNLRFIFDKITIKPTKDNLGMLHTDGEYFYKGFKGSISGDLPYEYPFKIDPNGDAKITASLEESKIQEIAPLLGGIDPKRSSGTIAGTLVASGKPTNLVVQGDVKLVADSLGFNGLTDSLKNVQGSLSLNANRLDALVIAESSRGGNVTGNVSTPTGDLEQLFSQYQKEGISSFLDRTVSGHFNFNKLQFRQFIFTDSTSAGTASGDIDLTGTLQSPLIGGDLNIASGDLVFKGVQANPQPAADYAINPRFDLKFTLLDPARMQSSTANMFLLGDGTLQGSLMYPKAAANLYVDHGTIRLPAALLRLDQGGTVKIGYQASRSATTAVANVDLEGETSVTTSRTGETDIQRYDITLGMKGDLLDSKGISLTASSDPPDLSQDRILAILGQTDFLQNLSSGFKQSEAVGAVAQFVVPSLLDPLTAQLAKGVGLDYISLEYNMFDQASVTFGKELGHGFSVVGTRQLSEPPPGFQPRFDFRLVFRPKRLPGALRQIRFFFGADQDRPWKLGLDYGIRF